MVHPHGTIHELNPVSLTSLQNPVNLRLVHRRRQSKSQFVQPHSRLHANQKGADGEHEEGEGRHIGEDGEHEEGEGREKEEDFLSEGRRQI